MTFFLPLKLLSDTPLLPWSLGRVKSGATSPTFRFVVVIVGCWSCARAPNGRNASIISTALPSETMRFMLVSLQWNHFQRGQIIPENEATDCNRSSADVARPVDPESGLFQLQIPEGISAPAANLRPERIGFREKRFDNLRVELHSRKLLDFCACGAHRQRFSVRPVGRHRVKRVCYRENPRPNGNLLAFQSTRIARAVIKLLV